MSPGIWHSKIKVELKNGSSLFIKSYETKDFNKMLGLIEKDFNEIVKRKY